MSKGKSNKANIIGDVQVTNDCLASRAGLNLFTRYLRGIDLSPHIDRLFVSMREHPKGAPTDELFKQLLCFLFDGTSRHGLAQFQRAVGALPLRSPIRLALKQGPAP